MPVELEMFLYLWEEQIGFPCLLLPECKCIYRRWRLLIFGSVAILDKLGMEVFYFEADRYIGRLRLLTVCAFEILRATIALLHLGVHALVFLWLR